MVRVHEAVQIHLTNPRRAISLRRRDAHRSLDRFASRCRSCDIRDLIGSLPTQQHMIRSCGETDESLCALDSYQLSAAIHARGMANAFAATRLKQARKRERERPNLERSCSDVHGAGRCRHRHCYRKEYRGGQDQPHSLAPFHRLMLGQ
jgi:hypothetical protein